MINICYSGSLDGYSTLPSNKTHFLKDLFFGFNNKNIDSSTRSGYYFIEAINQLYKQKKISPNEIHIHWWGNIDSINNEQVTKNNLNDFFTIDKYLPKQKSLEKLKNADVLFLPLEMSTVAEYRTLFIPGKLFEYISSYKPILALCKDSDCKEIIEKSGLGIFVEPNNINQIANVVYKIINDVNYLPSFKPNKEYIESFSFYNKTKELSVVFDNLLQ